MRCLIFIWLWIFITVVALSNYTSHDPVAGNARLGEMDEILKSVAVH